MCGRYSDTNALDDARGKALMWFGGTERKKFEDACTSTTAIRALEDSTVWREAEDSKYNEQYKFTLSRRCIRLVSTSACPTHLFLPAGILHSNN